MPAQPASVVDISTWTHNSRSQDGQSADNGLYQCVQSDAQGSWDNGRAQMPVSIRRHMVRYAGKAPICTQRCETFQNGENM